MSVRPVPASLARVGIVSASDNLFPGDVLNVGRAFINVFRPELEARLIRKVEKPCQDNNSSPCHSSK
ncbi:MAG: hypothetical protein B7Y56_03350 [Gallionellales bacterium 35-53-114]|jgi:hypothetical protein|nr:MAG: hypothetical protein B7Y56_03350 [Gallionellales bacterium 35-53-114]OYZ65141.1 MAG: hypothetical protein B7Y04_00510 [Gallionellales bacterium 24-53-125]OZB08049.1 MAG: hypothetical protein B7X61_10960 [Gallionellales bacterium 39-52-133]HQS59953.1 hypothetical protein [Gallionellaceae bacterium]HQS76665.1 hypothetical protein [Gallionellaceae bacterium]